MKKYDEPEPSTEEMMALMTPLIQLVDIGIKNGKTPKEIANYLTELFKEIGKKMNETDE